MQGTSSGWRQVARPDVGIVTSVAMAHVEYFGDLDGVARAKSELVAALPASGLAVLNYDDQRVRDMASTSAVSGTRLRGGGRCRGAGRRGDARRRVAAALRADLAVGPGRGPPGRARRATGPRRAGGGDCRAVVRRPHRRGHRVRWPTCTGPRCAWRSITYPAARCWWSTATTRTLHRPKRHCARWPSCRGSASWQSSESWPSWPTRPCPSTGGSPCWRRSWGSRSWDIETPLYGEAAGLGRARTPSSLLRTMGPGDAALGQGEPGGAARGRGPGLRRGRGRALAGRRRVTRRLRRQLRDAQARPGRTGDRVTG